MRFIQTDGKPVRYMVRLYRWNLDDSYCYHYLKDARAMYERLKKGSYDEGTILSIYDMKTDKRKAFTRF